MQVTDGSNKEVEKELDRLRSISDKSGTTVAHIQILERELERRNEAWVYRDWPRKFT